MAKFVVRLSGALGAALIVLTVGSPSALAGTSPSAPNDDVQVMETIEAEDYRSTTCGDAEGSRRSEAYSKLKATVDFRNNVITSAQATMRGTNYFCSPPHSGSPFRAGSNMTSTIVISTTDRISACRANGTINIGRQLPTGFFECAINAPRTWAQIGYRGNLPAQSVWTYSLNGFYAKYQGSGTVQAQNVVNSKGPNGVASAASHAIINLR